MVCRLCSTIYFRVGRSHMGAFNPDPSLEGSARGAPERRRRGPRPRPPGASPSRPAPPVPVAAAGPWGTGRRRRKGGREQEGGGEAVRGRRGVSTLSFSGKGEEGGKDGRRGGG